MASSLICMFDILCDFINVGTSLNHNFEFLYGLYRGLAAFMNSRLQFMTWLLLQIVDSLMLPQHYQFLISVSPHHAPLPTFRVPAYLCHQVLWTSMANSYAQANLAARVESRGRAGCEQGLCQGRGEMWHRHVLG